MKRESELVERDDRRMEALLYADSTGESEDENTEGEVEIESMDNLSFGDVAGDINLVLPPGKENASPASQQQTAPVSPSGLRRGLFKRVLPFAAIAMTGGGIGATAIPLVDMLKSPGSPIQTQPAAETPKLGNDDGEPVGNWALGIDK